MYRYTIVAEPDQKTKSFARIIYPKKICTLNSFWAQSYMYLKFALIPEIPLADWEELWYRVFQKTGPNLYKSTMILILIQLREFLTDFYNKNSVEKR